MHTIKHINWLPVWLPVIVYVCVQVYVYKYIFKNEEREGIAKMCRTTDLNDNDKNGNNKSTYMYT